MEHPPWLLVFLVATQATVYLCGPIAAVWNHRAMRARRAGKRLGAQARSFSAPRQRGGVRIPRRTSAVMSALVFAVLACAFVSPTLPLVNASTVARGGPWPQSLLASPSTHVYLRLGASATAAGRVYEPITPVHLSGLATYSSTNTARVGLTFSTRSAELLGEVLKAAATDGQVPFVSLAFRVPGTDGRPTTKLVDTFGTAVVTSVTEPIPGARKGTMIPGTVSLLLPVASAVTQTPPTLQDAGLFAPVSLGRPTTVATVSLGDGLPAYTVSALSVSRAALGAPLNVSFSTTAPPLLDRLMKAQNTASGLPAVTLSVQHRGASRPVRSTFARVTVDSFAENLSKPFSGAASLAVPARQGGS
jgi:hypothetical protein